MLYGSRLSLPITIAIIAVALAVAGPAPADDVEPVLVVDLGQASTQQRILCLGIQGLANREPGTPDVFLVAKETDAE